MGIVQLAGIGLLCCVLLLVLRELRPAFAPPLRVGITLLLFGAALALYAPVLGRIRALFSLTGAAEYASPLIRALGIALLCELSTSLCKDLGEGAVAQGVQLFGKLEILLLCLPLLDEVLDIAKELLEF